MGNVCCGSKEEASKATALDVGDDGGASHGDDVPARDGGLVGGARGDALSSSAAGTVGGGGEGAHGITSLGGSGGGETDPTQMQAVKEEQARLEWIVQATGRRMVGVRTNRSAQGYYVDQGFAAALYQHLEQTTPLPNRLPDELPVASSSSPSSAVASSQWVKMLSAPTWDPIHVRSDGYGGKHPAEYLDHVAETFLDEVVPKKNLFAGLEPIVDNLI